MLAKFSLRPCFTCSHDIYERHDFVGVFSGRDETLEDENLEVFEHVTALTAHYLKKTHFELKLAFQAQMAISPTFYEQLFRLYAAI